MNINRAQLEALANGVFDSLGEDPSKYDPANNTLEEQILAAAANQLVEMLRVSLQEKKGTATRDLLQSLETSQTTKSGDTVNAKIVGSEHWKYFEYGRKRGKMPPIKSIEEWITAKGIAVRKSKGESKQSVLDRRRSMAIAIAKKIGAKGTIKRFGYKGSDFIKEVLTDQNLQVISDIIAEKYGMKLAIYATTEE
jgi:hypothetical protein